MGDQAGRGIHRAIGMVEPKQAMRMSWLADLLREQRATGFADFAGAQASATIPISDRLATRLIAGRLSPSSPVREIDLRDNPTVVPTNNWLGNYFNGEAFETYATNRLDGTNFDFTFDGSPAAGST